MDAWKPKRSRRDIMATVAQLAGILATFNLILFALIVL